MAIAKRASVMLVSVVLAVGAILATASVSLHDVPSL